MKHLCVACMAFFLSTGAGAVDMGPLGPLEVQRSDKTPELNRAKSREIVFADMQPNETLLVVAHLSFANGAFSYCDYSLRTKKNEGSIAWVTPTRLTLESESCRTSKKNPVTFKILPIGDKFMYNGCIRKAHRKAPMSTTASTSPSGDKQYLCTEHDDEFTVTATSLEDAQQKAAIYGGRVVRELGVNE